MEKKELKNREEKTSKSVLSENVKESKDRKLDLRISPLEERVDIRFVSETGHKAC